MVTRCKKNSPTAFTCQFFNFKLLQKRNSSKNFDYNWLEKEFKMRWYYAILAFFRESFTYILKKSLLTFVFGFHSLIKDPIYMYHIKISVSKKLSIFFFIAFCCILLLPLAILFSYQKRFCIPTMKSYACKMATNLNLTVFYFKKHIFLLTSFKNQNAKYHQRNCRGLPHMTSRFSWVQTSLLVSNRHEEHTSILNS